MEVAPPSNKQRARHHSFRQFCKRVPEHARSAATWTRYLHLIRSIYTSPFAALVSVDSKGLQIIDWVDNRLDDAFPHYVYLLEAEAGLLQALRAPRPSNAVISSGEWTCIRVSFFEAAPLILIAVFSVESIDTVALHSFEKVLSDFLASPSSHEDQRAPASWGNKVDGAAH